MELDRHHTRIKRDTWALLPTKLAIHVKRLYVHALSCRSLHVVVFSFDAHWNPSAISIFVNAHINNRMDISIGYPDGSVNVLLL